MFKIKIYKQYLELKICHFMAGGTSGILKELKNKGHQQMYLKLKFNTVCLINT